MATVRCFIDAVHGGADSHATPLDCALADHCSLPLAVAPCGELALWLAGPGRSATEPMPDGAVPAPGGWSGIVVQIENFDARVSALKAAGVRFRNEPPTGPGGTKALTGDPAGNPIELFAPRP